MKKKLGWIMRRQGGWTAIVAVVEYAWGVIVDWFATVGLGDLFVAGYAVYSARANSVAAHKARRAASALSSNIEARMQMVRQAISSWRVIYGTLRVSGVITFFHSTNNGNTLHILLTLAAHEIEAIDDIYFDDELIPLSEAGTVLTGRWAGYAVIKKGLGSTAGDADLLSWMVANTGGTWTSTDKQVGHAKLYVQFTFKQELFATGMPNISCVVRGKKLYDPRTATTAWSDNAELCIRDYLTDTLRGFGATAGEINDTASIAAANICDERVIFAGRSDTFTQQSHSPSAPTADNAGIGPLAFSTGYIYKYAVTYMKGAGETTVGPISNGVYQSGQDDGGNEAYNPNTLRLTASNISIGPLGTTARKLYRYTYDAITLALVSTHLATTISDNTTTTYDDQDTGALASPPGTSSYESADEIHLTGGMYMQTGDGFTVSTTGVLPAPLAAATTYYWIRVTPNYGRVATSIANAMAGTAIDITTIGTGTHTLTVANEPRYRCNGMFDLSQRRADVLRSLLSACGGTVPYVGGKFSSYPAAWRTPTATLTEDDLDGPISVVTRLSRRDLFNGVKGIFSNPTDLWQPTDYPPVTNATYLTEDNDERIWLDYEQPYTTSYAQAQRLGKIQLEQARQQITTVWPCKLSALVHQVGDVVRLTNSRLGWSAKEFEVMDVKMVSRTGAEGIKRIGVDLSLRETASTVYDWNSGEETIVDPAPNTTLPSGTTVEDLAGLALASGTAQLYLRQDGTVFTRLKVSWTAATSYYILTGGAVQIEYRQANSDTWLTTGSVDGSETQYYILDVEDGVVYDVRARFRNSIGIASDTWTEVFGHFVVGKTEPPATVTGFTAGQNDNVVVMKWGQVADIDLAGYEIRYIAQGGSNWDAAVPLTKVTRGTQVTSAALPPGSWTLLIAARDTSGNYSVTKSSYDIDVTNALDIVYQLEQAPDWLGTKTNFVKHWTGVLIPDSQDAASLDTWDTFDVFVPNPYTTCTYAAPAYDIGFIDSVRVWASFAAILGPGETTGFPNPTLEIDYHSGAGYDGFESWTIGEVSGRYFKSNMILASADGAAYVSSFKPTLDVATHTESGTGVVIGASGTAITFTDRFHFTPNIQITVQGGSGLTPSFTVQSATGFTAHVYDSTGAEVGGTVNWTATGE